MNVYVLWKPTGLKAPNLLSPLAAYTTTKAAAANWQGDRSIKCAEVSLDPQLPADFVKDENDRELRDSLLDASESRDAARVYVVWSPGKFPFAFNNSQPIVVFSTPGHAWAWREWFRQKMGDDNIYELQISEVSLDQDLPFELAGRPPAEEVS